MKYTYIISFVCFVVFVVGWFALAGPTSTNPSAMEVETAVANIDTAPAQVAACDFERRQYDAIAENPPAIQPWLLTKQADEADARKRWDTFYQTLPPELRRAVRDINVIQLRAEDLIPGEAFDDQINVAKFRERLGNTDAINVVYADFPFGNSYRKQEGIYLRQQIDYLSSSEGFYSAGFENRFLSWLAYINL